ncbi:MAG: MoxR family ATPase [Trueperaceae bacterium]|nr:MoxR family ATPase [Trueperaceae bacterium]
MTEHKERNATPVDTGDVDTLVRALQEGRDTVNRVIVGQEQVVDQLLIALIAGGHVLIEGAPGLGKTLLVRTLARVCGLDFSRVQFTPDLMPADITGANVLYHDEAGHAATRFEAGPIFGQLVLTDEINRATPKTQSALLEAMQEHTVTAGGAEHVLPDPFFVLATQNPIEMEGTYDLPEAQIDRFLLKVLITYPSEDSVVRILQQTTGAPEEAVASVVSSDHILRLQTLARSVHVPAAVARTVARMARSSQPQLDAVSDEVGRFVRFGISPRGAQSLLLAAKARAMLEGRFNVAFDDLQAMALPTLRHRVHLNYMGAAEGLTVDNIIDNLLARVMKEVQAA